MRCNKAQEFLSLELDGVLPAGDTKSLDGHLDSCADCREYREDLHMGHRLLQATEPELPENFDWKLQLRLNQALKETAGEAAYPWEEKRADRLTWLRNFGSAAAVGLAAVLALAIVFAPGSGSDSPQPRPFSPTLFQEQPVANLGSDRLPLERSIDFGNGMGRTVSGGSALQGSRTRTPVYLNQGWTGKDPRDLRTIHQLKSDKIRLQRILRDMQLENRMLRAKLDTSGSGALDLGEE